MLPNTPLHHYKIFNFLFYLIFFYFYDHQHINCVLNLYWKKPFRAKFKGQNIAQRVQGLFSYWTINSIVRDKAKLVSKHRSLFIQSTLCKRTQLFQKDSHSHSHISCTWKIVLFKMFFWLLISSSLLKF